MPGKIFVSCGQASEEERDAAAELKKWLRDQGFHPYVAIQAQSIQDVNTAIISELKASDYYIFIDFPREHLHNNPDGLQRGSLFTHQELAIAYILGFEKVLFLRYKNNKLEGLLRYMASNAIIFSTPKEAIEKVKSSIIERRWNPDYTRHLIPTNLRWSESIMRYGSHSTGENFIGKFLYIDIKNLRSDLAAFNTVARLSSIYDSAGKPILVTDQSHLKVTGQPGYSQTIWPESHGAFDLLIVKADQTGAICLNSSLDLRPKPLIINQSGQYTLFYEVLSESFPVLNFRIKLDVTGVVETTQAKLIDG
jgi:hypothetical protein